MPSSITKQPFGLLTRKRLQSASVWFQPASVFRRTPPGMSLVVITRSRIERSLGARNTAMSGAYPCSGDSNTHFEYNPSGRANPVQTDIRDEHAGGTQFHS